MRTKYVSILGSTGSIGRQSLDVIDHLPSIKVCALTAGTNVDLMELQCRKYQPMLAVMATRDVAQELKCRLKDMNIVVLAGMEGLMAAAAMEQADTVITAVVGTVGLQPTMEAIRNQKRIGLANKETLVCAGDLVMEAAEAYGAEIIPVDSEHSAIFQCLMGNVSHGQIKSVILTCSGGPFFGMSREALEHVTKADALQHPNWHMGPKITVDCASLMNKGLEFIEAMRLYRLRPEQVRVVIHRQSIVHSLVEYADGAMLAQLGVPDMRLPIQLALTYPERCACPAGSLDLLHCGSLTFSAPDLQAFPCLKLAMDAANRGGTACAVLNGANEAAVGLFLEERIGFYGIARLVSTALETVPWVENPTLEEILQADRMARDVVLSRV